MKTCFSANLEKRRATAKELFKIVEDFVKAYNDHTVLDYVRMQLE
jgi:hypothetical protein